MKKIFFGFAVAVLTMCLTACNNKGVKQNEPTEEPQSKVLEAFADSVNGVAPMKWANVGDIEEVVYKDKVMTFTVKAPEELMEPSIKKWLSSFIVNNVHVFGPQMQQECLDKKCTMVFKLYTTDKAKTDYTFNLTPKELKKKFKPGA